MLRHALVAASLFACSSSTDGNACTIAGTYGVESEQQGGACPDLGSDTYTITADGSQFRLEYQGAQGFCDAQSSGTCGLQAKCDGAVRDPVDPRALATIQYALTFTESGFTGTVDISLPATASAPACTGSYKLTGKRR
jgi:hypothetical protein